MSTIIPASIVLDTNVCLDLFVFHDPRWKTLLDKLVAGELKAYTREDCRAEWLAVLHYKHLPISADTMPTIIARFDALITCVAPVPSETAYKLPTCKDRDDQKFLELARDIEAQYLISKDKAVLKLARRLAKANLYNILTPEQFTTLLNPTEA